MMLWTVYKCGHEHKHICWVWGFSITTKENYWFLVGYYHHLPHILHFSAYFLGTLHDSLIPLSLFLHMSLYMTSYLSSIYPWFLSSTYLSYFHRSSLGYSYRIIYPTWHIVYFFLWCSSSLTEDTGIVLCLYFLRVFILAAPISCSFLHRSMPSLWLSFIHRGCNQPQRPWASYREDHVPTLVYILIPLFLFRFIIIK